MVQLQPDPPEGAREVIERELARQSRQSPAPVRGSAAASDIIRIFGDIGDDRITALLALHPSLAELEQAAMWIHGDGDLLAKNGNPLAGTAAAVFDVVKAYLDMKKPDRRLG